jgi:SAM-dependent methyltransferase
MISTSITRLVQCPDCASALSRSEAEPAMVCTGCGRHFDVSRGYVDLRPATTFAEQTKYLDHDLHADARHESIAPPVLGSKIRNDMLREFLHPGPGDRVVDLGCGSGRAIVWNAGSGASILGVDISPFFAAEAVEHADLILGDLRRLPLAAGAFNKAWSLDVMEHLSPQALEDVLREANRVLAPGGALFIYTHVRKNGWPAAGVRLVNRFAHLCERLGLIDLRQERLRKSDHLNPLADHEHLHQVAAACGFRVERVTYYSPVVGAFMENVLARMAEKWLAGRAARRLPAASAADGSAAVRTARRSAQARVRKGGALYHGLRGVTAVMKLDLWLFGRIRTGPFFALLRKPAGAAVAGRGN